MSLRKALALTCVTRRSGHPAVLAFHFLHHYNVNVTGTVGEGFLFATLPDLRPPLQRNWWGIKVQNTCQKVSHIHSIRSNPLRFSHLSGGRHQAMESKKCSFLT